MKKTKHYFKTKLWLVLSLLLFGSVVQLHAQTWVTLYETNFQGWTENTATDRVCTQMDNGESAWKRNIRVTPNLVNTGITNNTDLPTADMNGSIGRGGGTNYLQLPAMEFNNSVRVTFYMAQASGSNSGFQVLYNQQGMLGCISGNTDVNIGNSTLILEGTIAGSDREVHKFQGTANLDGLYNIVLYNSGGSSADAVRLMYIKIETETSCNIQPTASFADGTTVNKLTADPAFTNALISDNTSVQQWSSSDEAVATVNPTTGEVTIQSEGTATIRVRQAIDGDICAVDLNYTLNVSTTPCLGTVLGTLASSLLTADNATENSFRASWAAIEDAPRYTVRVSQGSTLIQTIPNITGTTTTITGLQPSTTYTFTVQAIGDGTTTCSGSESAISPAITTKAPPGPMDCGSNMISLYYTDFSGWGTASGPNQGNFTDVTDGFQIEGGITVGTTGINCGSSGRRVRFPSFNFIAGASVSFKITVDDSNRNLTLNPNQAGMTYTVTQVGGTTTTATGNQTGTLRNNTYFVTFTYPESFTGNQMLELTMSGSGMRITEMSVCNGVGTQPYLTCTNYQDLQTNPTAAGHRLSGDLDGAAWSGTAVNAIPNIKLWNSTNDVTITIKGTDAGLFSFSNTTDQATATVLNAAALAGTDIPPIWFSPTATIGISNAYLEMTVDGLTYQVALSGATPRSPYIIADITPLVFTTDLITPSPSQSVDISGINLTTGVTLTVVGNGAERFTLSTTSISATDVLSGFTLNISYLGNIISGTQNAELVIASANGEAAEVRIPLEGKTTDPASESGSNIDLNPGLITTPMQPCQ